MPSTPASSPQPSRYGSPPLTIVLTVTLIFCFFVVFFSVYFCKCVSDIIIRRWNFRRTPSGHIVNAENQEENLGLEPELIEIFPSFSYESVKDFRSEKYGLECAICLAEFDDEDMLRLITVCYHVFHQECIDLWLQSHKTCPVCRRDLDLPKETLENYPIVDRINGVHVQENTNSSPSALPGHEISIPIRENAEERSDQEKESRPDHMSAIPNNENAKKKGIMSGVMERFSRSHSTGHSIVAVGSKLRKEKEVAEAVTVDRYTLRLKENVKVKMISSRGGHASSESCITFGDFSSPKNGDLGQLSSPKNGDLGQLSSPKNGDLSEVLNSSASVNKV